MKRDLWFMAGVVAFGWGAAVAIFSATWIASEGGVTLGLAMACVGVIASGASFFMPRRPLPPPRRYDDIDRQRLVTARESMAKADRELAELLRGVGR